MRTRPTILFFSPAGRSAPDFLAHWAAGKAFTILNVTDPAVIEEMVLRSLPLLVVIDADAPGPAGLALCTRLKADSYSAIVPLAAVGARHTTAAVQGWFAAGADEVITPLFEPAEQNLAAAFVQLAPRAESHFGAGDFSAGLLALAPLRAPVDMFFDEVMVNVDDARLRGNRLALLAQLRALMNRVADISLLAAG